MKHFAQIQSEFIKLAANWWAQLTPNQQRQYKLLHPKSKKTYQLTVNIIKEAKRIVDLLPTNKKLNWSKITFDDAMTIHTTDPETGKKTITKGDINALTINIGQTIHDDAYNDLNLAVTPSNYDIGGALEHKNGQSYIIIATNLRNVRLTDPHLQNVLSRIKREYVFRFLHEFRHYIDEKLYGDIEKPTTDVIDNPADYWNRPRELAAYSTEVTGAIEEILARDNSDVENKRHKIAINNAIEYDDFNLFFEQAKKLMHPEMTKHLQPHGWINFKMRMRLFFNAYKESQIKN